MNCQGLVDPKLAHRSETLAETLRYGEEAIQTATERDHPLSIVFAYYAVGVVALIQGEFDQAIAELRTRLESM